MLDVYRADLHVVVRLSSVI